MKLKKILIILGGLLILLLVISLITTYISYSEAKKTNSEAVFRDYFPFGKGNIFNRGTSEDINESTITSDTNIQDVEPNNKLIRVSERPVAGFAFIEKEFFPDATIVNNTTTEQTVTVNPFGIFERELKYGSRGEDVKRLQQTLNMCPELGLSQTGPGSLGKETELYVERTFEAVKKFQLKFKQELLTSRGLTNPTGILDEPTRKKISAPFVCNTVSSDSPKVKPGGVLKTVIRYIEKGTGNTFDYVPETGETARLTNQTIPRIQEAFLGDNGNRVFIRYLKEDNQTIETYLATVPKQILGGDGSAGELVGKFLEKNIVDMSLSPKKDSAFLQTINNTGALGGILTLLDENKKQVFTSPFSEWLSQWVKDDTITMTTKASGFVEGHMYGFNTKTNAFTKIFGNVFGLTTNTNPALTKILFSKSTDRGIILGLHNRADSKNYSLNVTTLPEKCTWSSTGGTLYCAVPKLIPRAVYPDEWYQGSISFNDQIIRLDPTQLYDNEVLVDPETEGVVVDAVQLQVDTKEVYTAFIDKKTNILYMVHN